MSCRGGIGEHHYRQHRPADRLSTSSASFFNRECVGSLLSLSLLMPLGLHHRSHFIRRYFLGILYVTPPPHIGPAKGSSVPTSSELSESYHIYSFGQHRQHPAHLWPYSLSSHMMHHATSFPLCGFSSRAAKCLLYHAADEATNSPTRYAEDASPASLSFPPILPTVCRCLNRATIR